MLDFSLTTLNSGLPVIQVPMKSVQSMTVLTLCNTGSRYEEAASQGLAHFLEHMVFKGTAKFPTAQDLAATVDAIGANFNAFTGKEYTGYYVQAASEHLELALDVVSDMLLTPRLLEADIEREKGVIVEELNMYADTPARHIGDIFEAMVYAGTGLAHNIVGSKPTINAINRQSFVDLLGKWYGLGNMLVVVAGDASVVGEAKTLELIEKYFSKNDHSDVKGQKSHQSSKIDIKKLLENQPLSATRLRLETKQTEQAHFILGWPGLHRAHPDRYALALLGTILGGNMSSRLFTEVREKRGLCYYVHSDVDQYHDVGVFGASAGVDPARIEEALEVTIGEFTKLTETGGSQVTAQELQKAKDYISGKLVLGLEDSESVAQFFGMKQLLLDVLESPTQVLDNYRAVTLEDVNRVAQDLIKPGELRLALIGPFADQAKFERFL